MTVRAPAPHERESLQRFLDFLRRLNSNRGVMADTFLRQRGLSWEDVNRVMGYILSQLEP